jgi:two-component system, OmpR family, phosphate regulon response regulator PhoB
MDRSTPSTTRSQRPPRATPVLIVDDDGPTRDILRVVLEEEGYPVADADTIANALAYLHAATTGHVVLLDWVMGNGDSGALLRRVEHDAALRRHCYVLLTAVVLDFFLEEEQQHLIDAHCIEVVEKPFDLTALLDTLSRAAVHLPA